MPAIGENAKKVAILEAKLEYFEDWFSPEGGGSIPVPPPDETEILRRVKENYPNVEAASLDAVDPSNL
jgi:hypothetical protein